MTLSQFFVDEGTLLYPVNDTQKDFLDYFILLTEEQQQLVLEVVKNMQANYHEKIDRQKEKLEQRKIAAVLDKVSDLIAKLLPPRWIRKIILKVLQQKKTVLPNSLHK